MLQSYYFDAVKELAQSWKNEMQHTHFKGERAHLMATSLSIHTKKIRDLPESWHEKTVATLLAFEDKYGNEPSPSKTSLLVNLMLLAIQENILESSQFTIQELFKVREKISENEIETLSKTDELAIVLFLTDTMLAIWTDENLIHSFNNPYYPHIQKVQERLLHALQKCVEQISPHEASPVRVRFKPHDPSKYGSTFTTTPELRGGTFYEAPQVLVSDSFLSNDQCYLTIDDEKIPITQFLSAKGIQGVTEILVQQITTNILMPIDTSVFRRIGGFDFWHNWKKDSSGPEIAYVFQEGHLMASFIMTQNTKGAMVLCAVNDDEETSQLLRLTDQNDLDASQRRRVGTNGGKYQILIVPVIVSQQEGETDVCPQSVTPLPHAFNPIEYPVAIPYSERPPFVDFTTTREYIHRMRKYRIVNPPRSNTPQPVTFRSKVAIERSQTQGAKYLPYKGPRTLDTKQNIVLLRMQMHGVHPDNMDEVLSQITTTERPDED